MKDSIILRAVLAAVLAATLYSSLAHAGPAVFHAEYVAEYQGLPIKVKGIRELIKLDENRYRLVSSANSIFAQIIESSEFTLNESSLVPLNYEYIRKGLGKNKHESSYFDWTSSVVEHDGTTSKLNPGTLDKLSYQVQLRTDVARSLNGAGLNLLLEYEIADEEKRKLYRFRIAGEETLKTPVGELRTIRVDRVRTGSKRQTTLWLAIDHEFLLVKLKQIEEDKGFELNLRAASINGTAI